MPMSKLKITFPDGKSREFDSGITGLEIAKSLGPILAADALACSVDGEMYDLNRPIKKGGAIKIFTWDSLEGKEVFWHTCSHIMALAVESLYPKALKTIGPAIDTGFYYDFDFSFKEEELEKIQKIVEELLKNNLVFEREEISKKDAKKLFKNNKYKLEILEEEARGKLITIYHIKQNNKIIFTDLCRGPHLVDSSQIKAFRVLKLAGAYWRGNEKNKMLGRIYGVSFPKQSLLLEYLKNLEEAQERDHRKLGKELEIFTLSEEVGAGLPLWLPNGVAIRDELEKWAKEEERKEGYLRVATPHITKAKLYEISGHIPYYMEDMYSPMDIDGEDYYLKPMNCPHTHMIYKSKQRSYRELPLRLAEYGTVYRYEKSGQVSGLLRVRGFTQNDAHIYCTKEQAKEEFKKVMLLHERYYKALGLKDYYVRLSLPSKEKTKFISDTKEWEFCVKTIKEALEEAKIKYVEGEGEAAFYGPKADFQIRSVIGREETASTNQLDFAASKRFGLTYIGEDGKEHNVYVIHRAPLGSHERFVAFLLEHFAGAFPFWLAPVQIKILTVADRHEKFAKEIYQKLFDLGFRVEIDNSQTTVEYKVRDAQLKKIPYMITIGDKEVENKMLAVRSRSGKVKFGVKIEEFVNVCKEMYEKRELELREF